MEKISAHYLKLYQEELKADAFDVYKDMEDYLRKERERFLHFFEQESEVSIVLNIDYMKSPYLLGLAMAFENEDYQLLNDAIYHHTKHRLLAVSATGCDHSSNFGAVLDGMACDYQEGIEQCFPEALGLCTNGYPMFVVGGNLLMALWYQNEEWLPTAYQAGEKFLGQKKGLWEKAVISFLLALADQDPRRASEALNDVANYSRRLDNPKLYKAFCTEAHGLYQIAKHLLSAADFKKIQLEDKKNISHAFIAWQEKKALHSERRLIVNYPAELQVLNDILQLPIPVSQLTGKGKRKILDDEQMKKNLVAAFQERKVRQ